MVALTQQSKNVVDTMLNSHDFIELVWKKCQLYEKMRQSSQNGESYKLACQALKNLITHNSAYQFTMERIKTICLFFKVSFFDRKMVSVVSFLQL